jgi:hypothetical protein
MAKDKPVNTLILAEQEHEEVRDTYCPNDFDSPEEFLKDLRETYRLDLEADADNREAALEDKRFVAGEQWDPVVLQQRQGLPCLVINTLPQFTAQLVGDWRTNRNGIKVVPAENGDAEVASIRSDLIRSIEQQSRATRTYDDTFESMIQCGDGSFRIAVEYANEDVFDQDIAIRPIDDALSTVWDRMSIDPTGRDAGHVFVDDIMPRKEFEKRFGKIEEGELGKELKAMAADGWCDRDTVRVTEYWRMVERDRLLVMFQDGTIYSFEDEDELSEKMDDYVLEHGEMTRSRMAPCKYAQMHLVTGFRILAGPYEHRLSRVPIIRMSGRVISIGERRYRYGLVRFMKDPARLRNFWRSTAAEQLGYAPKAQWIAPESAVEGREEKFRKAHMTRDPLLIYNDDATAPPERVEPPAPQMALLNEATVNTQDMKDVTGIHDASLGIKSNETSGKAIMARQREGDIASLTYYDNGNAAILEAGDVINQLITQIYDGTRIVRIIGEDEQSKLQKINDPMDPKSPNLATGKYDVAIETGASYTTRRVEAADAMMNAVQVWPQLMSVAGDLVAKAQDWPGAEELAERLRKTVPPQLLSDKEKQEMGPSGQDPAALMQQQAAMQEQMQQGMQELQRLQQENLVLKTKVDIETRKLLIEEYKAETDRLTAYAAIAKTDEEFNIQRLEHEAHVALENEKLEVSTTSEASTPPTEQSPT